MCVARRGIMPPQVVVAELAVRAMVCGCARITTAVASGGDRPHDVEMSRRPHMVCAAVVAMVCGATRCEGASHRLRVGSRRRALTHRPVCARMIERSRVVARVCARARAHRHNLAGTDTHASKPPSRAPAAPDHSLHTSTSPDAHTANTARDGRTHR